MNIFIYEEDWLPLMYFVLLMSFYLRYAEVHHTIYANASYDILLVTLK